MKTIMLYGNLGAEFGRVHHYDVATPIEALKALSVTIKGFKKSFIDGGSYRILVGGKNDLTLDETVNPISNKESIKIIPLVSGAGKSKGIFNIILGAALIHFSGGLANGLSSSFMTKATFQQVGMSLIMSGVSQLLFPPPKAPVSQERPENMPSFIFNGAVNTTRQGNPVPLCYGRMIVGSQVISAGLSVEQL